MGSAANSADDDLLEGDRGRREQTSKALHDGLQILIDDAAEDLKQGVESRACGALGRWVVDEFKQRL